MMEGQQKSGSKRYRAKDRRSTYVKRAIVAGGLSLRKRYNWRLSFSSRLFPAAVR
jgi:hypothetical protein